MLILFFAQLKDAAGCESFEIETREPMTTDQLWLELQKKFPQLAAHRATTRIAKNHEYVGEPTTFDRDDEVALIPPVSGG